MLARLLQTIILIQIVYARCRNECNGNGICNNANVCQCFSGYDGNECNLRSCPQAPIISDIAIGPDTSHQLAPCSGRGACNTKTGVCECDTGWGGSLCNRAICINDCNGHGECMSLREAAIYNDNFVFNRTTEYNLWDANVFHGCKCDPGYGGHDCSLRMCESGADPRLTKFAPPKYETATLVCRCPSGACGGKFKLNFMGQSTKKSLSPTSTARDVANVIMGYAPLGSRAAPTDGQPRLFNFAQNDTRIQSQPPIWAGTNTGPPIIGQGQQATDNPSGTICATGQTRYTNIHFKRFGYEMPALGIYANTLTGGSIVFETYQTLTCDCTHRNCNGTFRVSFDGEFSRKIFSYTNASEITTELHKLRTFQAAQITKVKYMNGSLYDSKPVCQPGLRSSHTYKFTAPFGNVARMGLWSSIGPPLDGRYGLMRPIAYNTGSIANYEPEYYASLDSDTNSLLTLTTNDGRDNNFHVCNGIGSCDYKTGMCNCPLGWEADPDLGPCAKQAFNSSSANGVARCPGAVRTQLNKNLGAYPSRDADLDHPARVFLSANKADGVTNSRIFWHEWQWNPPQVLQFGQMLVTGRPLFDLTTPTSAGPIVYDAATERVFFVDNNAGAPFIGVCSVAANKSTNYHFGYTSKDHFLPLTYTVFLYLNERVQGFTFDPDVTERKLYWTYKGAANQPDGRIAFASVDDVKSPPTVGYLSTQIGDDSFVVDPMGIAMHPRKKRVYWIDRCCAGNYLGVVNSANIYGDPQRETIYIQKTIGSHTSTTQLSFTDIVIDYLHNNTAFVMDAGSPPAVLAVPLDNSTLADLRAGRVPGLRAGVQRVAARGAPLMQDSATMGFMALDADHNWLVWADSSSMNVNYAYAESRAEVLGQPLNDLGGFQKAFSGSATGDRPIGIAFDFGYGHSGRFGDGDAMDCFGNGVCTGNRGHFKCQCFEGYYGDCSRKECPRGKAWFHEPLLDNVAHDVDAECSNMGTCDHSRGICACRAGFEGAACERMSCIGQTTLVNSCGGIGRCLSMRELATKKKTVEMDVDVSAVYGSKLWSATTWDADMVQGCSADLYGYVPGTTNNVTSTYLSRTYARAGQYGLECPYGMDVREDMASHANDTRDELRLAWVDTRLFRREVQRVSCTASAGSFSLTFRGYTTSVLPYNANPVDLVAALQALPTIGTVLVNAKATSDVPNQLCSSVAASNHYFDVTFVTELALVPLLTTQDTLTHATAKVLSVQRLSRGQGALKECSGKGECNRATGECQCWPNWGSSDGFGGRGTRGDCGATLIF